jgi:5'-methylthioadenosine phosphorylase
VAERVSVSRRPGRESLTASATGQDFRTTRPAARFRVVIAAREGVIRCMKVAFISGTSIVNSTLFSEWEVRKVETNHGTVTYKTRGDHVLINRHGYGVPLPPHTINYRANIAALAALGCRDIVSLNSVGSLKKELPPGTFVSCSDYVGLQQGPATFFDTELKGGAPGIANNLIPRLVGELAPEFMIQTGKVYVQMRGPRFETKAEIRIVKDWGDVIGMTAAHEADLCTEAGLNYNSLALIDNYANGLEGTEIDFGRFKELVKNNQARVNRLFERMLQILG